MAWRLRIDFIDGTSELDDEVYFKVTNKKCRPIMVGDIKELLEKVNKAYDFISDCDEDLRRILGPIINIANDKACSMCYQLGFETLDDVNAAPYFCFVVNGLYGENL